MDTVYIDKSDCCGCSACMTICPMKAITMKRDKEGFLYPSIQIEKCIECYICRNNCPTIDI